MLKTLAMNPRIFKPVLTIEHEDAPVALGQNYPLAKIGCGDSAREIPARVPVKVSHEVSGEFVATLFVGMLLGSVVTLLVFFFTMRLF